ncbi:hypothetical protein [Paenibacillus sp. Soil787]|uniref:hypothetical protein n=1 Tax=Paenibacillus sp. Soil787 TaxID=1736411 RepID=UPI000702CB43|nr:hypothetical protein [Paenibacillus sp. Soil787]KRF18404.1 hypothetical protein ASG93_10095 [Paenibacillus sp. Soil787]
MSTEDFWRRRLNKIPAGDGPFLVRAYSVNDEPIIIEPSKEQSNLYNRRIVNVIWEPRQDPSDVDIVHIHAANIQTTIKDGKEVWQLKLYNDSAKDIYVDVYAYQEELIGSVQTNY